MRRNGGFTLVEVMISMLLFAASLAAFTAFYASTARLNESSRNLTRAMNDARVVMEAIRDTAQASGLTGSGGVVTLYPQGSNLGVGFGLTSLRNEWVSTVYSNPSADPLPVTVQVTWQEAAGHSRSASLDSLVTRR